MRVTSSTDANRAERSDVELLVAYGRRNWWVVLACIAAALIAAAIYLAVSRPTYRATAVLLIQPQSAEPDTREAIPATLELVRSQLQVVTSQVVLDSAVRKLRLHSDPEFTEEAPEGASEAVLIVAAREKLADRIVVENDGRSYTISLTARSRDPDKSARIANTVASSYIDVQRAQKVRLIEANQSTLALRLADLRSETFAAEQAAEDYRRRAGLIPLSSIPEDSESYAASTPASREIIEMSKEHAGLAARRAEAQARYQAQQRSVAQGRGDSTSEVLSSQLVANLREQEAELARREAELLARYRPEHPLVRPIQAQLGQIRSEIAREIQRIHSSVASQARASNQAFLAGDAFMGSLESDRSSDLSAATRLTQLQREAKLKRDNYEAFAGQMQRAAERAGLQLPDVLLVSSASAPLRASNANPLFVLLTAAVIGLILGLVLGLLRSMRSDRLLSVERQSVARA